MIGSILFEVLKKSKENKEIISIWKYKDDDGFWAGYVLDYNEELVSIQHYTKYGKPDGVIIEQISAIKSIDFNDDYSKAMQCIIDYTEIIDKEEINEMKLVDSEEWQYETLKQLESNSEKVIRIEIEGSENYSGYIGKVTNSDFILNCVGKLGENEGSVIYRIEDVTSIIINDIENRKRGILHKWRKNIN